MQIKQHKNCIFNKLRVCQVSDLCPSLVLMFTVSLQYVDKLFQASVNMIPDRSGWNLDRLHHTQKVSRGLIKHMNTECPTSDTLRLHSLGDVLQLRECPSSSDGYESPAFTHYIQIHLHCVIRISNTSEATLKAYRVTHSAAVSYKEILKGRTAVFVQQILTLSRSQWENSLTTADLGGFGFVVEQTTRIKWRCGCCMKLGQSYLFLLHRSDSGEKGYGLLSACLVCMY